MTKSKAREATGQSSSHILLVFPNLNPGFLYRHQATAAAMVRPQMILLKEHAGISHSAQEPAYQQIKRPDVMMDVVRAALGTGAMDELIYDEKGGVAVDNDGANIMKILFANQQVQGLREYIIEFLEDPTAVSMATNQQWQPWCAAADHTFEGTHGHFSLGAQEPAYQQIKRLDVMVDVVRMTLGTGAMDELIHDEKGGVTVDNDGPNIMKILFANRQVQGLREYIIGTFN